MERRVNIWGVLKDIEIDYDVYSNESISNIQSDALEKFFNSDIKEIKDDTFIKDYIKDNFDISVEDIFEYVTPQTIYVENNQSERVVALLCDFSLDEENGLAIVFNNEIFSEIGPQDIIL